MKFPGFIGPSYASQSLTADAQACRNFYLEKIESGAGKNEFALYPTPGLSVFSALATTPGRGEFTTLGRMFSVSGKRFYEINADGTNTDRGGIDLATDGLMCSFAASATQLLIASGGTLYTFTFAGNAFAAVAVPPAGSISTVSCIDATFYALVTASQTIWASALNDATSWPALNKYQPTIFGDNIVSMAVDHNELWVFGDKKSAGHYDAGNANFPLSLRPGAISEQGGAGVTGVAEADNTLFWLGASERGGRVAWRLQGYTAQRISNHALEHEWGTYSTVSDVISFVTEEDGHTFWWLLFPTANKTWVYDAATGQWGERAYFTNGKYAAHLANSHAFCFNKHLMGDRQSGNMYQMSLSFYDDAGQAIRRERVAPHISKENKRLFYSRIEFELERGLGPTPDLTYPDGSQRGPLLFLSWSNDGAKTYSNEYALDCGQVGAFSQRVYRNRLGYGRDRVFKIATSDPVPFRIVDAYLDAA